MPAHPLAAFSVYLAGRHQVLLSISREIVDHLDACGSGTSEARRRASDLMWLWTLGVYEVVRTMCQARVCFSASFYVAISDLKFELERVRVPSTKMERIRYDRKARAVPVGSNREADVWDDGNKDLRVGDPVDAVSARLLLGHYQRVMNLLTAGDVIMRHEDSFVEG